MKVKEVKRTANVAWSPSSLQNVCLASGTAAQQLDASFSTTSKLEIFSLDLTSSGLDMPIVGSLEVPHRFHKLVWSALGTGNEHPSGVLVGGCDNGTITLWNVDAIMNGSKDATMVTTTSHVGPVRTLDINPFQPNLLASGASESEIFIWDLNQPANPMSPGNKLHPLEDIAGVAWNRQVQHILISTSPSGRSVVWDLRKNDPIIQINDSSSRIRCKAVAWHPDVATQMVTASEDDRAPIIQMWDLRYATAPMRVLERHKRGVLAIAWCPQDSDLLLSAAKDNQVFCWNPNSEVPGGDVVYELPATSQWMFECHWCPRNPAIISTASFDGHISLYSLLGGGGKEVVPETHKTPTIAPDDIFGGLATRPQATTAQSAPLKNPPKWLRTACGASFGFGGKLVSFSNSRGGDVPKVVTISQVITEQDLLQRSEQLENSLTQQLFADFCDHKSQESPNERERTLWNFLKVTFEPEPRRLYLKLLGYDTDELAKKFSRAAGGGGREGLDADELSEKLATIPVDDSTDEGGETERPFISENSSTAAIFGSDGDGPGTFDTLSVASDSQYPTSKHTDTLSLTSEPPYQPANHSSSFFIVGGATSEPGLSISTDNDVDGLLSQALLVGNFESAVDICIGADRMADAMILAIAGGSHLLQRVQQLFFQKKQSKVSKLMSVVVNKNWTDLARHGNLENWREILAALVTYAGPEDFASLCDLLGDRLEREGEGRHRDNASLCYICSGNVEKFVECWTTATTSTSSLVLQDLVEKVIMLRKAVERERRQFTANTSQILSDKLSTYADMLASQGSLSTAFNYLQENGAKAINAVLYDRLYHSLNLTSLPKPEFPFQRVDVQTSRDRNSKVDLTPQKPKPVPQPVLPAHPGTTPYAPLGPHPSQQPLGNYYTPGITGPQTISYPRPAPPSSDLTAPVTHSLGTPNPVGVASSAPKPMATPLHPLTPMTTDTMAAWNDPPMLKAKKTSLPPGHASATPITAPVMGIQQPLAPTHPTFTPATTVQQTSEPVQSRSPVVKQPPAPPGVQKPPIPQEDMVIVLSLDGLLERCKAASTNTSAKRKVEDIATKLTTLSDLLRESKLSQDVLQGLHYIAQAIQMLNYQAGLAKLTELASSANFSEISSFMPAVKALLQLGQYLKV
ncbi:hypothetical protein EMCRGX_G008739 [Ephydatia muelleri]